MKPVFDMDETTDSAWCPGCGNFGIHNALKQSLEQLQLKPEQVVLVSGIGQAAKLPHYVKSHVFNGLHGRYLSSATAIKAVNPGLTVIAVSGDGCTYGEGGNHFIHTIRRNPDITNIVHNNLVYGLTKGQASPTSLMGFKTPVQIQGVMSEPFNPLSVAIALDASFVARAFAGDIEQMKTIFTKAIKHRGYALVDVLQPCVTFNKVNTYQWFKEHTYNLESSYDPHDRSRAFERAVEKERLGLGIFYINEKRVVFEDTLALYRIDKTPLSQRSMITETKIQEFVHELHGE
ncbi:MAG TPA: thiamine pyrophosphate-dependent enzyme [bacterium]